MGARDRTNAEHYTWGGSCDGWRLLDRPDLAVIEERMPQGASEAAHRHRCARQLFYVLEGELRMDLEGDTHTLGAGASLEVEPGRVHRAHNAAAGPVRFLVVSAPTTRGDREDAVVPADPAVR